ncbi:UpxY family transcription antiterminator [Roseivirga sp.]|uniref:UpxY family transcription antiterminator n=1 Tax=Roseivirga sp. TaxID=1964215 RepID=UPI003B8CF7D2
MNNNSRLYWTAFYTKPRSEKKTTDRLVQEGYEVYCPTRTVVKQWSDRKKKVSEPIFTSYIFAKVNEQKRNEILSDQGVVSSVFWLGKPAVIRDQEILAIQSFLNDYPLAQVSYGDFESGSKVQISSGPLTGQNGLVRRIKGAKAYLTIVSLGIEVQAEISLGHLKKVG